MKKTFYLGLCCPSAEEASHKKDQEYTFKENDSHDLTTHSETFSASGTHPLPQVHFDGSSDNLWKNAPLPCCCFEYVGMWNWCRLYPPRLSVTKAASNSANACTYPTHEVNKHVSDDVVVEFAYKSIPDFKTTKLTMHLDVMDLKDGKTADDMYAFAQNLVTDIGVRYGEEFKSFEEIRAADAIKQLELAKKFEEAKKEEDERKKLVADAKEAEKLLMAVKKADELRQREREAQQYEDDKILRNSAREQVMYESNLRRSEAEEAFHRKALERKLLEAGKIVVTERCKCAVEINAASSVRPGFPGFSFNFTSPKTPLGGAACTVCSSTAGGGATEGSTA